jgi:predicted aspartyl protease
MLTEHMGTFRVDVEVENPAAPGPRLTVHAAMIDTGAELSWFPASILDALGVARRHRKRFRQVSGTVLERWTGTARVFVAGTDTADDIVFAEPGDLTVLGSRSLEGLNLTIDPVHKRLIDAGPAPAAVA